ncbi:MULTISPECIES: sigma-70 RNA polymerase sigma factor region 4 domain-containing protein [Bacillus]|uniref:sigma-70 family RNA polymerase sigma factor n=1 Tax=Bacillus TaxID=1386 RepID=UPI0011AA1792|nr:MULTISPECIES: sigma-70 family RNA polymerase sigma factor [Bacillus]MCC2134084.1 sigma-70 family RNA polymerase sigma factor [Bacillus licheniformis]MCC2146420.1 sigma-70 family RNA polymerase sigma factor [Bacillus licheniformis]MCC2161951.1 sigma-70 family RNA polymerase sigma factor [Bacillus licheniformis]MCC2187104.1 sigma-70 family RNA polymerase sigma factor [Bacillus licheniformis]MCX2881350.1 sigma-70 family RNA polymerase sigma factor [Bacillus sp. AR11]
MNKNKNLIELIQQFQTTGSPRFFEDVYKKVYSVIESVSDDFSKKRAIVKEDIISALNERLWNWASRVDLGKVKNVEKVLYTEFRNSAIDVIRGKNGTYVKKRIPIDTTAEENAATFESESDFELESYVVSKISGEIKTDHDKRQLIEALTQTSDALTTAIVKEHLSPEQPSARQIGRKLGVHHYTVTREIRKLAKNYDASQYGDISAYLAV